MTDRNALRRSRLAVVLILSAFALALLAASASAVVYYNGFMPGGGSDNTGWISGVSNTPGMHNYNTATAKRIERYQNGVGQTGAWNRDPGGNPTWFVGVTAPANSSWTCRNRSTGGVNVVCEVDGIGFPA